jgi:hypothetical protein
MSRRLASGQNSSISREGINRASAVIPILMSLLVFLLVLAVITTGWERGLKDEGAAVHIFQLLIVAQIPFLITFLMTADWKRAVRLLRPMAFQAAALLLALGPVAFFKL